MQNGFFHVFDKFEHFFRGRVHAIRRFRISALKTISHTVFSLILIRAKTTMFTQLSSIGPEALIRVLDKFRDKYSFSLSRKRVPVCIRVRNGLAVCSVML